MEEAKLTNLQRSKIHYHLRNGDSLPTCEDESPKRVRGERCFTANFKKRYDARRRSLDLIKLSGSYEIPDSVVGPFREPNDLAKKRLQATMSGIKGTPRTARRLNRHAFAEEEGPPDTHTQIQQCKWLNLRFWRIKWVIYDLVLDEIRDRAEWLDNMERLGQGKQHRVMIQNQIGGKLREIKRLEKIHHEHETLVQLEAQLDQLKM